jgi:hypothetical protein
MAKLSGGKMIGDYGSFLVPPSVMVFLSFNIFTIIRGLFPAIMFSPPDTPKYDAARFFKVMFWLASCILLVLLQPG